MAIDTSLLLRRGPDPAAQGMRGLGGILEAMMLRKRREQEFAAEQAAKAQELQFRRDQESRLTKRQEMMDERDNTRESAREQRETQGQRIKGYEAVSKAKTPQARAFLAQLYGGTVEQAKPDYSAGPDDPLGSIDFLENVEEDESSPLGFSYGINPEHERRTQEAARTQVMTMPGGQPINLPDPEQEEDHFSRLERQIAMLPPGSPQQMDALMRLREARALQLDPKATYGSMQDGRQMAQRDALAARRRRGGGSADPTKNKADDLDLLDLETGEVTARGRTPGESTKSRDARPAVIAARQAAGELKSHIDQYKNISRWNPADWLSGDVDQQAVRDQMIDRLVGARKEITGALNADDIVRYKKQLDTAAGRGPDAVKAAIDSFVRELENMYRAKLQSAATGPMRQSAPAAAPAAGGDRLDAWESRRGR